MKKINAAKSVDDVLEARELVNDALRDFFIRSRRLRTPVFTLNTKDEFYSAEKDYYDEKNARGAGELSEIRRRDF
ncbi:MAG: hypothetical protein L6V82_05715 [Clostridiales bacterium]|nr:MAG: hypothetical protein L6V82_05715 [Clostridiales bacterium]